MMVLIVSEDTIMRRRFLLVVVLACWWLPGAPVSAQEPAQPARWSRARAKAWYAEQSWLVGCNFIPSTAVNQLEMWQADTCDFATIDRELGWAADKLGF